MNLGGKTLMNHFNEDIRTLIDFAKIDIEIINTLYADVCNGQSEIHFKKAIKNLLDELGSLLDFLANKIFEDKIKTSLFSEIETTIHDTSKAEKKKRGIKRRVAFPINMSIGDCLPSLDEYSPEIYQYLLNIKQRIDQEYAWLKRFKELRDTSTHLKIIKESSRRRIMGRNGYMDYDKKAVTFSGTVTIKGRIIDYLTFYDGREIRTTCQEFFDKIIKINDDLTNLL